MHIAWALLDTARKLSFRLRWFTNVLPPTSLANMRACFSSAVVTCRSHECPAQLLSLHRIPALAHALQSTRAMMHARMSSWSQSELRAPPPEPKLNIMRAVAQHREASSLMRPKSSRPTRPPPPSFEFLFTSAPRPNGVQFSCSPYLLFSLESQIDSMFCCCSARMCDNVCFL